MSVLHATAQDMHIPMLSASYTQQKASRCINARAQPIMVNSCTGKMGHATAEAVLRAGLELIPYTLCGSSQGVAVGSIGVSGIPVDLVSPEDRDKVMREVQSAHPDMIVIDYTLPAAVNSNCEFYCEHGVPFVMGTTGGDRNTLLKTAQDGDVYAVIAPQMGKQVVAFQAMMDSMAKQFPGAFSGYTLEVIESHQRTKADTSGTAKAVVGSLQALCPSDFKVDDIQKIRNQADQMDFMGVPMESLDGHAFHTYRLTSPDKSVNFEFQHNVCGRTIYADGTVDAALFLADRIRDKCEKKIYNMIDVLSAGTMR